MKKFVFIYWFIVASFWSFAQSKHLSFSDSLKNELRLAKTDTDKVKLLDYLSYVNSTSNYEDGIKYASQAESLAEKADWEKGIASANIDFGLNYVGKCDYVQAIIHYKKAFKIYQELNDKQGMSSVYADMGLLYRAKSDYIKALENNFKALSILEELNQAQKKAIVLENIGTIYLEQRKHSKALEYYALALADYKKINDKDGTSRNLANQGIILNEQGEYEKALNYHLLALKMNQEKADENSVQINLANVGITYCYLKKYPLSLSYHLKALALSQKMGDIRSTAINLGNTGELYYFMAKDNSMPDKRHLGNSINYLESAIKTCREINFDAPCIEFCQFLSNAYLLSENYKKALEVFKQYTSIRDTVFSQEARLKIAAIETKRAIDLKNKDILLKDRQIQIEKLQVVNKKNERVIFLITIGLLFIIIFLLFRLYNLRNKTHKKVLSDIANIQSHQVRGPLARILGLAQLFDHENAAADINKKVVSLMNESALELDDVIRKTVNKASE